MKTIIKKTIIAAMALFTVGLFSNANAHTTISGTFTKVVKVGNIVYFTCPASTNWCCRIDDNFIVYEVNSALVVLDDPSHTYDETTDIGSCIVE